MFSERLHRKFRSEHCFPRLNRDKVEFYKKIKIRECWPLISRCRIRMEKMDIVILGVSKDSVASHKKFTDKYHLNFPLLSDPERVYEKVNPLTHAGEIIKDLEGS